MPRSCGGARRETLAAKTAGTSVSGGVRGDRSTPLGGAKPARTRTLRPGPTCSARQALGQSVSEPGLASCRANAEHSRRPCPPRFPSSSGPKRPRGEACLPMGSGWWRRDRRPSCRRRRASTDSQWCWGPPPTEGIFTVFSSQGRAPSLDEGSVYWAGACTGPSTPAESEPSALRVPSMSGPRPVLIPPARGFAPSRGVSGVAALGQTPQGALHGPVSRLSLGHCRVLLP